MKTFAESMNVRQLFLEELFQYYSTSDFIDYIDIDECLPRKVTFSNVNSVIMYDMGFLDFPDICQNIPYEEFNDILEAHFSSENLGWSCDHTDGQMGNLERACEEPLLLDSEHFFESVYSRYKKSFKDVVDYIFSEEFDLEKFKFKQDGLSLYILCYMLDIDKIIDRRYTTLFGLIYGKIKIERKDKEFYCSPDAEEFINDCQKVIEEIQTEEFWEQYE